MSWRDTPADWRLDGIAVWLLPHAARQRGEPAAREQLARALDMAPHALPITRDTQGRPHFIAPLHHLETGWSHSGEALLLALGEDIELGVDIERLRPRPRAMDLAERFYHPEETAWLRGFDDDDARLLAFVRLWCIKEAVLKAHGQGISFGLHRFHVALDEATPRLATCDPGLGRPDDWHLHLRDGDALAAVVGATARGTGHCCAIWVRSAGVRPDMPCRSAMLTMPRGLELRRATIASATRGSIGVGLRDIDKDSEPLPLVRDKR